MSFSQPKAADHLDTQNMGSGEETPPCGGVGWPSLSWPCDLGGHPGASVAKQGLTLPLPDLRLGRSVRGAGMVLSLTQGNGSLSCPLWSKMESHTHPSWEPGRAEDSDPGQPVPAPPWGSCRLPWKAWGLRLEQGTVPMQGLEGQVKKSKLCTKCQGAAMTPSSGCNRQNG